MYNCNATSVNRILSNNNIVIADARNRGLFPPCMEWEKLYNENKNFEEIANLYHCSKVVVKKYFDYVLEHGNDDFQYRYYKKHK